MSRFLSLYEEYVSKRTDAPKEFGHAAGLTCLSAVTIGNRWLTSGLHPNLYVLLVGPSSRDRKSTSIELMVDILRDVAEKRMGPSDGTPEGLMHHMRRKRPPAVGNNKLLLTYSEFGHTLASAQRTYSSGLGPLLCQLYDGTSITRVRSGVKPLKVVDPRVSLIGGCAYGMLEKYVSAVDWEGGFFARIIFVRGLTRPNSFPSIPDLNEAERSLLRMKLADLIQELEATQGAMALLPETKSLYEDFIRSIPDESGDPAIVAHRERLINTIPKLALLYQVDEDPKCSIGLSAMRKAIWFGGTAWASFRDTYMRSSGHPRARLMRRLWRLVDESGGTIAKRDLMRSCHLALHEFQPTLEQMRDTGIICFTTLPDGRLAVKLLEPYQD